MAKAKKVEKKDNKNLITIVLLIIAGIVILSYTNNIGNVAKSSDYSDKISVTPEVREGGSVIIKIDDKDAKGKDLRVLISYDILNSNKKVIARDKFCNTNTYCNGPIYERFNVYESMGSGTYYVRVKVYNGPSVEKEFKIL